MPMYDYRCPGGHRFERVVALSELGPQACPACGDVAAKMPSRVALGGVADTGRTMEMMPQTWRGTHNANPEYVTQLRRDWSTRQRLEDKHPELQGDRRPILAHEGRYEAAPLRLGDPLPSRSAASGAATSGAANGAAKGAGAQPKPAAEPAAPGHSHGHGHSHGAGHSH